MRVSVLSVGTEIVRGDQVDSNGAWLSQRLREIGVDVVYHLAAADDHDQLSDLLAWSIERSDAILIGGGLGPTPDDLTREAVAAVAGVALESRADLEEEIVQVFAERGYRMSPSNLRQAQLPVGATAYPPLGTAPGFTLDVDGCRLYVLPGVPWEQQGMFQRDVLPDLLARVGQGASVTRTVHVSGMGESTVAELVAPVAADHAGEDGTVVSYLATGREVQVRVSASGPTPDAARERTEPLLAAVRRVLGRAVVGVDEDSIEAAIGGLLADAGQTVAFAESATAGGISARMATVAGASAVLKGGVAVYATESKVEVLGVAQQLIDDHTAVSEEVTRELAVRVRDLFGSDWGVGVTGVAGPGAQAGKRIGTVCWAVAGPDGQVTAKTGEFPGDREAVQRRLGSAALEALRRRLEDATG
jgi:nicotinamide-nucleotide amidase